MNWILILSSNTYQRPAVVIGGYGSLDEAVAAGEAAIYVGLEEREGLWPIIKMSEYASYTVIPGIAAGGHSGMGAHGNVRVDMEKPYAHYTRWRAP